MQHLKTKIIINRVFDRLLRLDKLIEFRAPEAIIYKEIELIQNVLSGIQETVRKNYKKKGSVTFKDTG